MSTLPEGGDGQTLVTLGPCSGSAPHTHPRGSEISYVITGNVEFGIVEENQPNVNNLPVIRNMTAGQTIHVLSFCRYQMRADICQLRMRNPSDIYVASSWLNARTAACLQAHSVSTILCD